jgi:energy-coupling factor transport system substrate-specific component
MTWQLGSLIVVAAALVAGFRWYERQRPPARVVSLVAALAALAVVGRLAFVAFPNVKPTTDIVLFAGYALGPAPGFAVGAVTAIASNVFLGQGPWTVWQMLSWGGVGVGGALLARAARGRELGRLPLAIACAVAGLAFGVVMDLYQWTFTASQSPASYLAVAGTSLPYNVAHAAGNFVFCLAIGPPFIRALRRYRRRFEVHWEPPRAGAAAAASVLAAVALVAGLASPPQAEAASAAARASRYLEGAQNRDGGFGGARGQRSSQLYSGWVALGLASARHNPAQVRRRGGRSVIDYMRGQARALNDVGELERTILVLKAAGASPRRFAGRDLVSELMARRRGDGSWEGLVNRTAFGVLALRAAGGGGVGESAGYLERAQNGDGGFGYTARAGSDLDDTGAVLQALAAAGRGGAPVRRAVAYVRKAQNGDGGFGQMAGRPSNAQSTAWAVQGLVAVGARGRAVPRALAYLGSLQNRDGSVRYSRASRQTPVWVTAQALTALRKAPFPLATVRRARRSAGSSTTPTAAGGDGRAGGRRVGAGDRSAARRAKRAAARARALAAGRRPVATRKAGARTAEDDEPGVPAGPVAAGAGGALALLFLVRRRLWRRSA